jgi:hypothetical protein
MTELQIAALAVEGDLQDLPMSRPGEALSSALRRGNIAQLADAASRIIDEFWYSEPTRALVGLENALERYHERNLAS